MNIKAISAKIKEEALNSGFSLCGISSPSKYNSNILNDWLNNGYHGNMHWISKRKEERNNIYKYFPNVKSVISFGYNYYTGENSLKSKKYKISNYAWGEDYHKVIKTKLYEIITFIKEYKTDLEYRVCVDTSPILEKHWGQRAGIGWIGKHTNLINENYGSWFFLAEILLDFKLQYDKPYMNDLCGTCTKCIEECPTDAIFEEYKLDSNKCISYLTIEHRNKIPDEYINNLDNWIYGCDICQQVCPWNQKFHQSSTDSSFKKRDSIDNMKNSDWECLTESDYKKIFKNSAVKRTKYSGLIRNIKANKTN